MPHTQPPGPRRLFAAIRRALRPLPTTAPRCGSCQHFLADREHVEQIFPGMLGLSSAFGDSWGDAGLCTLRQQMCLPFQVCSSHVRVAATETPTPPAA